LEAVTRQGKLRDEFALSNEKNVKFQGFMKNLSAFCQPLYLHLTSMTYPILPLYDLPYHILTESFTDLGKLNSPMVLQF